MIQTHTYIYIYTFICTHIHTDTPSCVHSYTTRSIHQTIVYVYLANNIPSRCRPHHIGATMYLYYTLTLPTSPYRSHHVSILYPHVADLTISEPPCIYTIPSRCRPHHIGATVSILYPHVADLTIYVSILYPHVADLTISEPPCIYTIPSTSPYVSILYPHVADLTISERLRYISTVVMYTSLNRVSIRAYHLISDRLFQSLCSNENYIIIIFLYRNALSLYFRIFLSVFCDITMNDYYLFVSILSRG